MSNMDKAGFECPDDRGDAGIGAGLLAQDPAWNSSSTGMAAGGEGGLGVIFGEAVACLCPGAEQHQAGIWGENCSQMNVWVLLLWLDTALGSGFSEDMRR